MIESAPKIIIALRAGHGALTRTMGFLFFLLAAASYFPQSNRVQGFSVVKTSLNSRNTVYLSYPPVADLSALNHRRDQYPFSTIQSPCQSSFPSPQISLPYRSGPSTITTTRLYSSSTSSSINVRNLIDWVQGKPLDSLVSKDDTVAICRELTADQSLLDSLERAVVENWDRIVEKLIQTDGSTKKTLRGLLGEEATERLLRGIQKIDLYSDPKTVNAFLQSDAVNDLFAQTLYDGIYEFFQTIDVFGNIISNLPVLGPIRNKIRDDLKAQLDRTLGPTIRNFIKGYTAVATSRAAGFVLSEQNQRAFGTANARLLQSLLDRPLEDLLPESSNPSIAKLRSEFFGFLRDLGAEDSVDLEEYATLIYDIIGDKSLDSLGLNVHRVLDASPTLERTANRILCEALENR